MPASEQDYTSEREKPLNIRHTLREHKVFFIKREHLPLVVSFNLSSIPIHVVSLKFTLAFAHQKF